ncbi:unnamed protein product [Protopolystoma xenopodis]|uniref:Uncharacterized protein n=1 Tax=Protopolystoma xenopodis TaxID=117903 RepID=A0A448XJZ4_9PLAT|nr:unnamed protein product [Protopolystoma xenopodis]
MTGRSQQHPLLSSVSRKSPDKPWAAGLTGQTQATRNGQNRSHPRPSAEKLTAFSRRKVSCSKACHNETEGISAQVHWNLKSVSRRFLVRTNYKSNPPSLSDRMTNAQQ